MKKVILLASAAVLVVLASCKADGTCTCKIDGETSSITKYEDVKYAKAQCEASTKYKIGEDGEFSENAEVCEWSK